MWRFFDALAWNWLIAGTDAHAKNYSLLLAADEVRFAPLYDISSALPYGTHPRELRFAIRGCQRSSVRFLRASFDLLAARVVACLEVLGVK